MGICGWSTYSNGVFRYDVNKKEWKNFYFSQERFHFITL